MKNSKLTVDLRIDIMLIWRRKYDLYPQKCTHNVPTKMYPQNAIFGLFLGVFVKKVTDSVIFVRKSDGICGYKNGEFLGKMA